MRAVRGVGAPSARSEPRSDFSFSSASPDARPAPDARTLARQADARYGTSTFTWLVDHEPSAVVTWGVPAATVRGVLPHDRVLDAPPTRICAATHHAHALLLVIAPAGARAERDAALDCGFAMTRDAGGMVIAPL